MQYRAKIQRDSDGNWLVEFPDCPGCQTFGESEEDARDMAEEAIGGWLEVHLEHGDVPPRPKYARGVAIDVAPGLGAAIALRWARERLGVSQAQLAKQAGVSQQQIAKLEGPGGNPSVETLGKIARLLGGAFDLVFVPREEEPRASKPKPAAKSTAGLKRVHSADGAGAARAIVRKAVAKVPTTKKRARDKHAE